MGAGDVLETVACPERICPWVRHEEEFVSCARAAEVNWLDMGTNTHVAKNMETAESNPVMCVFSCCADDPKGRMVGILHVARSAIRLC